jgi:hypothetical protein
VAGPMPRARVINVPASGQAEHGDGLRQAHRGQQAYGRAPRVHERDDHPLATGVAIRPPDTEA